ncbi:MAG: hypothetical protein WA324_23390, partial [Bryobacteraceae bacterium]
ANVVRVRRIRDRYIDGTRLRLRQQSDADDSTVVKLTQKIPSRGSGAQQGFLTTMYLNEGEFDALAKLPAKHLNKTRYSMPPFGIDVFEDVLEGLVLAEAEFDSALDADALTLLPLLFRKSRMTIDSREVNLHAHYGRRSSVGSWNME